MKTEQIIEGLKQLGCEVTEAGSRVTCNPPPTDTDHDFLVFAPTHDVMSKVDDYLYKNGFENESISEHYQNITDSGFMSYRWNQLSDKIIEHLNFIVTKNETFVIKHKVATALCKKLNLMKKADRIDVFQAVLYAKGCEPL